MNTQTRSISTVLLDFVFGEPLPQPVVIEEDTAEAWQKWLNAVSDLECVVEFEPTKPMPMD